MEPSPRKWSQSLIRGNSLRGVPTIGIWLGTLGTLSKDVFERRTSTGSEAFSLSVCLDANKLVLLSFFSLLKTIYPRVSTKPLPNDPKSPLPVDVRRSKTLLLKLPILVFWICGRLREVVAHGSCTVQPLLSSFFSHPRGMATKWRFDCIRRKSLTTSQAFAVADFCLLFLCKVRLQLQKYCKQWTVSPKCSWGFCTFEHNFHSCRQCS